MKLFKVLHLFPMVTAAVVIDRCSQQTTSTQQVIEDTPKRSKSSYEVQSALLGMASTFMAFDTRLNFVNYDPNLVSNGRTLVHLIEWARRQFQSWDYDIAKREPEDAYTQDILWDNTNALAARMDRALTSANLFIPFFYDVGVRDHMVTNLTDLRDLSHTFFKDFIHALPDFKDPMSNLIYNLPYVFDHTIDAFKNYQPGHHAELKLQSNPERPAQTIA